MEGNEAGCCPNSCDHVEGGFLEDKRRGGGVKASGGGRGGWLVGDTFGCGGGSRSVEKVNREEWGRFFMDFRFREKCKIVPNPHKTGGIALE